jgi:Zn finger protein HypA/HybF involved in hydrogenase expression
MFAEHKTLQVELVRRMHLGTRKENRAALVWLLNERAKLQAQLPDGAAEAMWRGTMLEALDTKIEEFRPATGCWCCITPSQSPPSRSTSA